VDDGLVGSLRRAVEASPDDVALRLHLAQMLLAAGEPDEAITHASVALSREPQNAEARRIMSDALAGPVAGPQDTGPAGGAPHGFDWHAAENNMTLARPSTPASYFHLLRRQAYARPRRPLVVFTPKSMLRLRGATSEVADFTSGRFEPVLDDARHSGADTAGVRRVLLHAGKIHYDLLAEMEKNPDAAAQVALVRLEQYYPLPEAELRPILDRYPNAELVWVQDEPENQGAWPFIDVALFKLLEGRPVHVVSRPASASPATGSSKRSAAQQTELIEQALTL
jgi:2-oxoglutarate dehydrogenase complex dehydrogenase (E1) component-like enzyme